MDIPAYIQTRIATMSAAILKKKVHNRTSDMRRILHKINLVEIRRFNFLPVAILYIAAMLAAILKSNIDNVDLQVKRTLFKKRIFEIR